MDAGARHLYCAGPCEPALTQPAKKVWMDAAIMTARQEEFSDHLHVILDPLLHADVDRYVKLVVNK